MYIYKVQAVMCSDSEAIDENLCPICRVPRQGRDKHRALREHVRVSKDPAHVMWRDANYTLYFKHGGDRTSDVNSLTPEAVKHAVARAFGDAWAQRVAVLWTALAASSMK